MYLPQKPKLGSAFSGLTLVEMLIVIAIICVLMTLGAIGIGNMGGKGVSTGVATAENLFDEARTAAKAKNIRACVLVAKSLDNNPSEDLRRIVVAYEETDPATGEPTQPDEPNPKWVLTSRGTVLPDQTFYSETLSSLDHAAAAATPIDTVVLADGKTNYQGTYFIYQFNGEGICSTPGASFVIGMGTRNVSRAAADAPPRVTASGKRDFGGFVIWRNGGTSLFRSPEQISGTLPAVGGTF